MAQNISDFSLCRKTAIFSTEFVIFLLSMKQNELEEKIFFLDNFSSSFWPKIVISGTDFILRVKTMYESVK